MGIAKRKRKIEIEIYSEWDEKGENFPLDLICIDKIHWFHTSSAAVMYLTGLLSKEMSEVLKERNAAKSS